MNSELFVIVVRGMEETNFIVEGEEIIEAAVILVDQLEIKKNECIQLKIASLDDCIQLKIGSFNDCIKDSMDSARELMFILSEDPKYKYQMREMLLKEDKADDHKSDNTIGISNVIPFDKKDKTKKYH